MPYTIKITENVAPGIPAVTLRLPGQPIHFVKGDPEADHRSGVEIVATESRTVEQIVAGLRRDGYKVTEDGLDTEPGGEEPGPGLFLDAPEMPAADVLRAPEPEPDGAMPPADPFTPEEADPLRRPLIGIALGPHAPDSGAPAPAPDKTSTVTTAGPVRGGKPK